ASSLVLLPNQYVGDGRVRQARRAYQVPPRAAILIDQAAALAGNINPRDTPRLPVTITQPGHYQLTNDLLAPQFSRGIQVKAPRVTIDLNGFAIRGPIPCDLQTEPCDPNGFEYGITSENSITSVTD